MDLLRLAGFLFVASFVTLVIGALTAPAAAYRGPDLPARLRVIAEAQARWRLSKVFDGLAVITPAAAAVALALALGDGQPRLPLIVAALGFLILGGVGLVVVYRLAFNPEAAFTLSLPPILDVSGALGLTVGMLFLGWAYLQGALPTWIGVLSMIVGVASLIAYFSIGFAVSFYVVAAISLVNAIIGAVIISVGG